MSISLNLIGILTGLSVAALIIWDWRRASSWAAWLIEAYRKGPPQ